VGFPTAVTGLYPRITFSNRLHNGFVFL
jgi:hypothetical protein